MLIGMQVHMSDLTKRVLTSSSQAVCPGDVFVAIPGATVDGRDFVLEAVERGASVVLCEANGWKGEQIYSVPIIPIPKLAERIGFIAAGYYGFPSDAMSVVGVTGTNGKTSITHYLAQILTKNDQQCGIVGTLGSGFISQLDVTNCTTPDAIRLQEVLLELKKAKASTVAIEVSSHALEQHRVNGINFTTVVFSNLTQDHLDYHITMEQYWKTKKRLFTEFSYEQALINLDDTNGRDLFNALSGKKIGFTTTNRIPKGIKGTSDVITTHSIEFGVDGVSARIDTPWGKGELVAPVFGNFSVSNLLAALGSACLQGVSLKSALAAIRVIQTVPGRMMLFKGQDPAPNVLVDYAHTPDALLQVLLSVQQHCVGEIWCVFGCGGDRDCSKRSIMVSMAEANCDKLVLTQDNPRTEDPMAIIDDMLKGAKKPEKITTKLDRREAIQFAIRQAKVQDLVVIAGKGHETVQILDGKQIAFSDIEEVQKALEGISL